MESLRLCVSGGLVVLQDERIQKALVLRPEGARLLARLLAKLTAGRSDELDGCQVVCDEAGTVHLVPPHGWVMHWPLGEVNAAVVAGLRSLAGQIEEQDQAEQLIADGGLLAWMGLPVGLTDNPELQHATRREAEKYCGRTKTPPGGIEPRSIVGTPAIQNLGPGDAKR